MKNLMMLLLLVSSISYAEYAELRNKARKNNIELTEKEMEVLENGKISDTRYILGGILGTYPLGLGIGHAIQGRYSTDGWKFTVGEIGSLAVAFAGATDCVDNLDTNKDCNSGLVVAGLLGYVGFRIWEIIDLWAVPPSINRKYDQLKDYIEQYEKPKVTMSLEPFVSRQRNLGLGLNIRF